MTNEELGVKLENIGRAYLNRYVRVRAKEGMQAALPYSIAGIILQQMGDILSGNKTEEEIIAYLESDIPKED